MVLGRPPSSRSPGGPLFVRFRTTPWPTLVCLLSAIPAAGQVGSDSISGLRAPAFRVSTPYILGGAPTLAAAILPFDPSIRDAFRGPRLQNSGVASSLAAASRELGEPWTLGVVGGATAAAWLLGNDGARDAGLHTLETFVTTGLMVAGMKTLAGRARPHIDPGPYEYALTRGFRGAEFRSFPSGHTAQAFALAASLGGELSEHFDWSPRWLAPVLYGAASMTGLSRIYHDRHWGSDVVMGAAIGTLASRLIQRLHHH